MATRDFAIAIAGLTFLFLMPAMASAQQAARIRATASVVGSVLPETQAATAEKLQQVRNVSMESKALTSVAVMSSRGFAHVCAERLSNTTTLRPKPETIPQRADAHRARDVLQITVAYTAN